MRRPLVAAFSLGGLAVSFVTCWVWFAVVTGSARFEPLVTGLGIVGGVIGVIADREAARRDRREHTAAVLAGELRTNAATLAAERSATERSATARPLPRVYPRLRVSAVEAAIVSGGVQELGDPGLGTLLHAWRDTAHDYNRRLDITELLAFLSRDPAQVRALDRALHRPDGHLTDVADQLTTLLARLPSTTDSHARRRTRTSTNTDGAVNRSYRRGKSRRLAHQER
jgi:hypothetical protein